MSVIERRPAPVATTAPKVVKKKNNNSRYLTHAVMAVLSVAGCGLTALYKSEADPSEIISIGTGYVGLLMIAATLVIGPINLFRKRRNPVNIDLRRDVGIWAGINVIVHVFFSFQLFQKGQILQYFVGTDGALRTDIFGLSNDVGLIALLVLLPILITSNQISLKLLKGKRWKTLQRLTYGLIVTGVLHTAGFILYNARETVFSIGLIGVSLAVLVAQGVGVAVTLQRERQRALANATPVAQPVLIPVIEPTFAESQVARRQFIKFVGGTILAGIAMGTSAALVSHALSSNATASEVAANDPATAVPPTNPPTSGATGSSTTTNPPTGGSTTPLPSVGNGSTSGSQGVTGSTNNGVTGNGTTGSGTTGSPSNGSTNPATGGRRGRGGQSSGTSQPPTNNGTTGNGSAPTNNGTTGGTSQPPTTNGSTGNIAAPANPTTPATNSGSTGGSSSSTSPKGTVLATVSSLAAGKAMAITTPSGSAAFLIHRTDGSVACYSGICTHEPVALVYEEAQHVLYCPRHDVGFSTQNGAPSSPPARRSLASYVVTVDSQGNIVYSQS